MKNKNQITCDNNCGKVVLMAEQGSTELNPLRGWITIHDNGGEKHFCSSSCKHHYERNSLEHSHKQPKADVHTFRQFFRLFKWPARPRPKA
jgi:hypothetical protein